MRALRLVAIGLCGLLLLVALALGAGYAWLTSEGGHQWVVTKALDLARPHHGALTIDELDTNLFTHLRIRGMSISDAHGKELLHLKTLDATYTLRQLVTRTVRVSAVQVEGLRADLTQDAGGLDISGLWTDPDATPTPTPDGPPEPWSGLPVDVIVESIAVTAPRLDLTVGGEGYALTGVSVNGGLSLVGAQITLSDLALDSGTSPDLGALKLRADAAYGPAIMALSRLELGLGPQRLVATGALAGEDQVGVHISQMHVEAQALPWDLPITGAFDVTGQVSGLVDAPVVELVITTPGGLIDFDATLDQRPARPTWTARVALHEVAIHAFVPDVPPTVIDARLTAEGSGLSWPEDLDATAHLEGTSPQAGPVVGACLSADAHLTGGVATVTGLKAAASTGSIDADARVDVIDEQATATVRALTLDLADLRRYGVAGLGGSARFAGTVAGTGAGQAPAGRIDGDLSASAISYETTARAATLTGPVHATWADAQGTFDATLEAIGVIISSVTLKTARMTAQGTASQGGAVRATAQLMAVGIAAGSAAITRMDADTRIARTEGGVLVGDATLTAAEVTLGPVAGDRAIAQAAIDGGSLTAKLDLFDGERVLIGVDALGDLTTMRFELPRLLLSPAPEVRWQGEGVQAFTLVDDGAQGVRLALSSEQASVALTGAMHTGGALDLHFEAHALSLEMLGALSPDLRGYKGLITLAGDAGGQFSAPTFAFDLSAEQLQVPEVVSGVDATLHVEGEGSEIRVGAKMKGEGQTLATLTATVPANLDLNTPALLLSGPLEVAIDAPAVEADALNAVLVGAPLPAMSGRAALKVTGALLHPVVDLTASAELPKAGGEGTVGLDLVVSAADQQLTIDGRMREGELPLAALAGTARLHLDAIAASLLGEGPEVNLSNPAAWGSELDFALSPDMQVQALSAFVSVPEGVSGRLTGAVHLKGSADAPTLDLSLVVQDGLLGAVALEPASFSITPTQDGYDVKASLGFGPDGGLDIDAFVPIELRPGEPIPPQLTRRGLKVDVRGEGVPLETVAAVWPQMRDAAGRVEIAGAITGSLSEPIGDVRLTASDASFRLRSTGVAYDQVGLSLVVDPASVRLEGLHVRTSIPGRNPERGAQGIIEGSLHAAIDGTTLGDWQGELTFDHALLCGAGDRFVRMESGRLTAIGAPPGVSVDGDLQIEEARIHLDQRFFVPQAAVYPPPWLTVHRTSSPPRAEAPPPPPAGIPEWLAVSLGLDLGNNVFLRAQLPMSAALDGLLGAFASVRVDAQTQGQVKVNVTDAALTVTGQIVPVRGTVMLFGKAFEISDDSTVFFTGKDVSSPVLDLRASLDTRGYGLVTARISGIPEALSVDLTSTDYPSQDDVISLLLIGKPASEMSSGEGARDGAAAAAMSMLLTTLGQSVGGQGEKAAAMLIAPDLFVVGNETARVGKSIGSRLFVVVDINNTADDVNTSYLVLTVDLDLWGPWAAEFTHGTAGQDTLEVGWSRRY